MDDLQYKDWVENNLFKTDQEKTMQLTKDIYKEFPDNYDFILLILNENSLLNNFAYHGFNRQVSHKIRGIRNPVYTYYEDFDWGPSFGSNYKLQSITQINYKWVFKTGPLLHELMHTWGNDAIETEAVVELGTNITSIPFGVDNGSHWGFTGGNIGGQLGGFKQSTLEYLGSNTYLVEKFYPNHNNTLDRSFTPYNELELYLAGMIPIDSVKDFDVFKNITSFTQDGSKLKFVASSKTTYTSASLEQLLGKRIPDYNNSQKDFKMLTIIITNKALTEVEWEWFDDEAKWFETKQFDNDIAYNFYEATRGIGTITIGY